MLINEGTQIKEYCDKILKLSTREDGTVDQDQLDRRLGMLFADRCLKYIQYIPEPEKPDLIKHYEVMSKDEKFRFDKENPEWRRAPSVIAWIDESSAADAENHSNVYWLKKWSECVDETRAQRLRDKLREFGNVGLPPPPEPVNDPAVNEVMQMFGGELVSDWRKHSKIRKPKWPK